MWKWLQSSLKSGVSPAASKAETFSGIPDALNPPAALKSAIAERECVLFAGEELSRMCAMPVWPTFLLGFSDWLACERVIEGATAEEIRELHRAARYGAVLASLKRYTADRPELPVQYAQALYLKPAALSRTHEALSKIPFCAALTPNLDALLERIFRLEPSHVLTLEESGEASERLAGKQPFLMKMRGSLERPETACVWLDEALSAAGGDAAFTQFMTELLNTRTLLIAGAGLKEIELWLGTVELRGAPARTHYAAVPLDDAAASIAPAKELHRRYNLHVLRYPPKDTRMIVAFLQNLVGEAEIVTLSDD